MTHDARRRLVRFVADRVAITADMSDDDINAATRQIQDEAKKVIGADPELFHETVQAALRSVMRRLRGNAKPRTDDDDEAEFFRARRENGFHGYRVRE